MNTPQTPLIDRTGAQAPNGLLFVGDPHLWSKKPGRRRDVSFMETVLGKLAQCARIANERGLQAVILGDLLHDDGDNDTAMLIRLARVLRGFLRVPICLVGNHDKDETWLSERNALLLLGETGQIDLIDRTQWWGTLDIRSNGQTARVAIGGTPYGGLIPQDVTRFENVEADGLALRPDGVDTVVWLTHEDLAFEGAYPGAQPLRCIPGVDMVVNGHMHGTTLPHLVGTTAWYNPGNITRMSVDMDKHVPSVWAWSPFDRHPMMSAQGQAVPRIERVVLHHVEASEIFDFEGRHSVAARLVVEEEEAPAETDSGFVARIKQGAQSQRTDDALFLRETLHAIMEERKTGPGARQALERLVREAVQGGSVG